MTLARENIAGTLEIELFDMIKVAEFTISLHTSNKGTLSLILYPLAFNRDKTGAPLLGAMNDDWHIFGAEFIDGIKILDLSHEPAVVSSLVARVYVIPFYMYNAGIAWCIRNVSL